MRDSDLVCVMKNFQYSAGVSWASFDVCWTKIVQVFVHILCNGLNEDLNDAEQCEEKQTHGGRENEGILNHVGGYDMITTVFAQHFIVVHVFPSGFKANKHGSGCC